MDQANPYQAPEPVLPTATEVPGGSLPSSQNSNEDLVYGLKLLRVAVILFCITSAMAVFWNYCTAYCELIDDPLPFGSDFYTYWLGVSLNIVGEGIYLAGLYFCSTHKRSNVSRVPLLIALVLGAVLFPDELYQQALHKPWIYFEGLGNSHASFAINYLAIFSNLASCCWLILWTTAEHDSRNLQRTMGVLFLLALNCILLILGHTVYILLIVDQPTENQSLAIYGLLNGSGSLAVLISNILSYKIYTSLIANLHVEPIQDKQPAAL